MKIRFFLTLALSSAILISCSSVQKTRKAESPLDRAIKYIEIPVSGPEIPLSKSDNQVSRVPYGSEVDINSTIRIEIDTAAIQILDGYHPNQVDTGYPASRAQKMSDTLVQLQKVINSRLKTLDAYQKTRSTPFSEMEGSQSYKEFVDAVSEFGKLRSKFNTQPIWEDGTFTEDEVVTAFGDKTYKDVGALLQRELDKAQQATQEAVDQANRHAASIRLEAFLEPNRGDPTPIHLEGYDTYTKKEVKLKDNFVMDADDRKVFREQYDQTLDLARQAEKVRTGEASLNDALFNSGSASLKQLIEEIEGFKPLLTKDWPMQLTELKQDVDTLNQNIRTMSEKQGKNEINLLRMGMPDLPTVLSQDLPLNEAKQLVDQITNLHTDWRKATPDTFTDTFFRIQELPTKVKKLAATFKTAKLENTEAALLSWLVKVQERPAEITEQVWHDIREQIQATQSFKNIKLLAEEVRALNQFLVHAAHILKFVETGPPSRTNLKPPEVQDVPLAEAPSTSLELTRTPRAVDDNITVSAALKVGEKELPRSNATFVVRYFGWHSVLAPSITLTRPINPRSSFDQDFKFAPAVAWLQKYYPRTTGAGRLNAWARFFQMGIGLHVAFLDQNPDKDTEIGVGGAISLWHDRIVIGAGCDLMDNSRGYIYIGSNLIPILQALGYAKEGKTGKEP